MGIGLNHRPFHRGIRFHSGHLGLIQWGIRRFLFLLGMGFRMRFPSFQTVGIRDDHSASHSKHKDFCSQTCFQYHAENHACFFFHIQQDGVGQISSAKNHAESGPSTPSNLPDRPGQPDCQYFLKTGTCKYGTSCKYHHPKERRNQVAVSTVGPLGLPLRPGEPVCSFYTMYGSCKYGSACKFDHPQMVGYYNYNYNYAVPALSIQDPSLMFPNQRSSQVTVTAPQQRSPSKAEASDDDRADPSSQSSPSNNNEPHSQSTQDQSDQN